MVNQPFDLQTDVTIHVTVTPAWLSVLSCLQVTVLRSYDTMTATARRQPEGSLVYVIEQTDLYLRVRDGVRQVHVRHSLFYY